MGSFRCLLFEKLSNCVRSFDFLDVLHLACSVTKNILVENADGVLRLGSAVLQLLGCLWETRW